MTENTEKKTLRLKKVDTPADADIDADIGNAPAMATMSMPVVQSSGNYKVVAIVSVVAALIFATIVILQLMELQVYNAPVFIQ